VLMAGTACTLVAYPVMVAAGIPDEIALPAAPLVVGLSCLWYHGRSGGEYSQTVGWFFLVTAVLLGAMVAIVSFETVNPWLIGIPTLLVEVAAVVGGVLLYRRWRPGLRGRGAGRRRPPARERGRPTGRPTRGTPG